MSSLYIDHFGLREPPFGITPNGKFFFDGRTRGAILQALHHAVLDEDGIIVVVGEVGSGKTMLCRKLAEELPRSRVDLVYLSNPAFGPQEILHSIVADWGLTLPPGRPVLLGIQDALMQRHASGRRVVLLIDEAQAMPADSLEEIKLLSNLETAQRKLLQIVLFGQEELDDLLALPKLRQVRDRVVQRFDLVPLTVAEAQAYVDHRLVTAGGEGRALFAPDALDALVRASAGRIRAIHLLADKALLAAYAARSARVELPHVQRAMDELRRGPARAATGLAVQRLRNRFGTGAGVAGARWAAAAAAGPWLLGVGCVTLALAALGWLFLQSSPQPAGSSPPPTAPALAPHAVQPSPPGVEGAVPAGALPVAAPAATQAPSEPAPPQQASVRSPLPAPASAGRSDSGMTPTDAAWSANAVAARYAHLPEPFRSAVLATRLTFDDPLQSGWTLHVGNADDLASAQRLWISTSRFAQAWVHDRQSAVGGWLKAGEWAVYAGRYHSSADAWRALQALQAELPAQRIEVRTLAAIRAVSYPDRPPT